MGASRRKKPQPQARRLAEERRPVRMALPDRVRHGGLVMLMLCGLLLLGYGLYRWVPAAHEPVRVVDIRGTGGHVSEAEVRKAVADLVQAPFFAVDLRAIERRVRALPWVYRVSVRRLWPDTVRITVSEQQAVARWGEDALLNPWGEVFRPTREDIPAGLPRIDGRLSRKDVLIKAFIDMNTRIEEASGGRHVARLAEDRRGAWQIVLDNGLEIELGRREQQQRLGRLLRIYRRVIAGKEARVGRIDARYSNGLAIAWQGEGHNSRGEQ